MNSSAYVEHHDYNSAIYLSEKTMEALQLLRGDVALVTGNKDKRTVLVVLPGYELEDGYAYINHTVCNNVGTKHGDVINVYPCDDIPYVSFKFLFFLLQALSKLTLPFYYLG